MRSSYPLCLSILITLVTLSTEVEAATKKKKSKKPKVEVLETQAYEDLTAGGDAAASGSGENQGGRSAKADGRTQEAGRGGDTSGLGSIEARRVGKSLELNIEPIGFTPYPTIGLYGGYYLSHNQIITLRLGVAAGFFSEDTANILSAGLKTFWGNTFFTHVAASTRSFDLLYSMHIEGGDSYDVQVKPSAFGVEFSIGNQWQWSRFTLGTEWAGVFLPVATSGTDSIEGALPGTSVDSLNYVKKQLDRIEQPHYQFLRLYLGFAF